MDEDRTSLSGTHSNDTIIELAGATATDHHQPNAEKEDSKTGLDSGAEKEDSKTGLDNGAEGPRTSGFMFLDMLKLKKRKIGHRRVTEEGEVTFKKIQSSWIVGSIQLGIGHAVGRLASKPERDLLMQDFALVETTSFPRDGSALTPAHRFTDFTFRAYAPVAFRHFRDLFGIRPDDFLISLCNRPLRPLANPGASGSLFYVTHDDNFILKTVDHREADFLQKLLPGYYMNLSQNPRTLLPKFFGLYCFQCRNKNVRLVVMNNLLPSSVPLQERYDLKGSTYKRRASKNEQKKASPTCKDLDFRERHPDGLSLDPETHSALTNTLKRDCRVLESFKIMDYSLLVGIHNLDVDRREKEEATVPKTVWVVQTGNKKEETAVPKTTEVGLARSKSLKRLAAFSTAIESIRADVEVPEGDEDVPPGGIPAQNGRGERLLLFLGVIDILQSFVFKKKLEHTFKAIVHDGDTVSVHRPGFYAQRFLDFMSEAVFRKSPTLKHTPSKRKGRKTSTTIPKARSDNDPTPGTSFDAREEPLHSTISHPEKSETAGNLDPISSQTSSSHTPGISNTEESGTTGESDPPQKSPSPSSSQSKSTSRQEPSHSTISNPEESGTTGDSYSVVSRWSHSEQSYAAGVSDPPHSSPTLGSFHSKATCVTWAETEVLELSQVVIETIDIEEGPSGAPSSVSWTPPHSVGGSTPTHTEGTPSLTESSPSPTTPFKGITTKSFDSLGPLDETVMMQ